MSPDFQVPPQPQLPPPGGTDEMDYEAEQPSEAGAAAPVEGVQKSLKPKFVVDIDL